MIAEIPALQCVSCTSSLLAAIWTVRRNFADQFEPTDLWQRVR
jgi:hypothetical protein